jgi:hypothetical protein
VVLKANKPGFVNMKTIDKILGSPFGIIAYLALSTGTALMLGIMTGNKYILPLLTALPAYFLMIYLLSNNRRREAVLYLLMWAFILGLFGTIVFYTSPSAAEATVLKGAEYREEMFSWIRTGVGTEGTPSLFIPQHLLHLSVFITLSLITVSSLSILFGAILMNYMSFYVSQLMLHTSNKILMFIVGWHFWSLFRIAGFVILGVVLSEFLLHRIAKYEWNFGKIKIYLIIALSLIILDIITKTIFAPMIGEYVKSIGQF